MHELRRIGLVPQGCGPRTQPLLYLSEFIETHRQDYYDCLERVRTHGDWQGWLLYFPRGVDETARRALKQAATLGDLREVLGRK